MKAALHTIPIKLSAIFISIFLICTISLCVTIINISDFILGITADILILYTYFTYKLAKISVITPFMLFARESHTKDLKDFLQYWHSGFPYYLPYNIILIKNWENKLTINISNNWKYKDILENHLPGEFKGEFLILYESYEKLINKYEGDKISLYEKIRTELCDELVKKQLDVSHYTNASQISHNDFAELCFKQYTTWLGPQKKLYYDIGSRGTFAYGGSEGFELHLCPDEEDGRHPTFIVAKGNSNLRLDASGEDTRPLEKIFGDMMFSENYLSKYKVDIDSIIQAYNKLKQFDERLKNDIDIFSRYPLLPGTKCYILKYLYIDSNWEDF